MHSFRYCPRLFLYILLRVYLKAESGNRQVDIFR